MTGWNDDDVAALESLHKVETMNAARMREQVSFLRQRECPWSVIGEALGISRQAAHKRFRSTRVGLEDRPLPGA